jgi:putative oxidoreductase
MLLPLIFGGGGRLSVDHLLSRAANFGTQFPLHGFSTAAVGAAVFAIPFLMLIPAFGIALAIVAVVLALFASRRRCGRFGSVEKTVAGNR